MKCLNTLLIVGIGALLGISVPALAQDALSSGNALDANLNTYAGPRNSAVSPLNFNARNLLVTDNVVDGRGFRGTVGYTAARDFRGETGSLGIDAFNQLSAFSNPQVITQGSTFTQLRFTQAIADVTYLRTDTTPGIDGLLSTNFRPGDLRRTRMIVDRATFSQALAAQEEREVDAQVIGRALTRDGDPMVISSSSLRGVSVTPPIPVVHQLGLSSFDLAKLVDESQQGADTSGIGGRFDTSFSTLVAGTRVEDTAVDKRVQEQPAEARIKPAIAGDYEEVLLRIAERYAEAENVDLQVEQQLLSELDDEFETLRKQLSGEDKIPSDHAERPGLDQFERPTSPSDEAPGDGTTDEPADPSVDRPVNRFGAILRHGERVARLTSNDETRFNDLMKTAEEQLRKGEYFYAERRFERALRFYPGHPLATAGLGHAQVGAGLYLPAALTLRSLLERQPEMIDVAYEEGLLPNQIAVNNAIEKLQDRLGQEGRLSGDRASDSFLLAYLGHQLDDAALIEKGLEIMAAEASDDPLVPLLQLVWAEGGSVPESAMPEK